MLNPADYFKVLSKKARSDHDAWWLISERIGTEESRKAKLHATLQFFGEEAKLDLLSQSLNALPEKTALSEQLKGFFDQLVSDLEEYVDPEEREAFHQTYFGILPLSSVDGFCLDRTDTGERLNGYLVVLNEGLWICAQLLAKAFVLENLDGDFAAFRQSGRPDFNVATQHYLSPSGKNANRVFFENTPPDVEGQLSAAQSSMAILILQFVVLHEFGHIVNHDFQLMGEYRFHIGQALPASCSPHHAYWDAECNADEYSLAAICRRSRADINRWANFITIYVFFHWLASIEKATGGPLCPLHPPPQERADRLLKWMYTHYLPSDEIRHYIERTGMILQSWTENNLVK